mmetsp:Transcript_4967/g.14510  ORF Transcript_4967/g.14510 Transcript_4967/m.14510 type:complete len:225 (-) Transcript_4967:883-1557(-)
MMMMIKPAKATLGRHQRRTLRSASSGPTSSGPGSSHLVELGLSHRSPPACAESSSASNCSLCSWTCSATALPQSRRRSRLQAGTARGRTDACPGRGCGRRSRRDGGTRRQTGERPHWCSCCRTGPALSPSMPSQGTCGQSHNCLCRPLCESLCRRPSAARPRAATRSPPAASSHTRPSEDPKGRNCFACWTLVPDWYPSPSNHSCLSHTKRARRQSPRKTSAVC